MQKGEMVFANKIVRNPEIADEIEGKYQIVVDQTLAHGKFDNLNKAICIMAEKSWRCINITSFSLSGGIAKQSYMYALMEKV